MKNTIIGLIAMVVMLASCSNPTETSSYTLDFEFGKFFAYDSLTVMAYEPTYDKLFVVNTATIKGNKLELTGDINQPMTAFVKFNTDQTPYFFILEPGVTKLEFGKKLDNFTIYGKGCNAEFCRTVHDFQRLSLEIEKTRRSYAKAIEDSTLTEEIENKLFKTDSAACDSLQRIIVEKMNSDSKIARILKETQFYRLDSAYMHQVK